MKKRRRSGMRNAVKNYTEMVCGEFSTPAMRCFLTVILLLATLAFPCFLLYHHPPPFPFFSTTGFSPDCEEYRLQRVLKEAAMEDRTIILTTLNEAWSASGSILDLFLESFRIGDRTSRLLNHLVIISLDQKAYNRCLDVHTYCFALTTEGVNYSKEAYFMTPDYLQMMWTRIRFLQSVLEMGYNFVFTDADIMWFRDPFPRFYLDADFQIACDHFLGSPYDIENRPNGGFKYVKTNNRTIAFYKFWYSSREIHPGYHDQDVLNIIKYDPIIEDIGLQIKFLNTAYFGGFCELSEDLNQVCTMHANCCYGLDSKLHDLRIMLEDWKNFTSSPPNLIRSNQSSWHVPKNCSLEALNYTNFSTENVELGTSDLTPQLKMHDTNF